MRLTHLVALCLTLLVAGCGPRTPRSAEIDPALARLIPSDTVALVDVKVDALRTSPLYQKYVVPRLASLKLSSDVSEVLAVSSGKDGTVFTKGKSGLSQYDRLGNRSTPPSRSGGVPPALRDLLSTIPPTSKVFAAGLGSALPSAEVLPREGDFANLSNVLRGVQTWTVAADLASGVNMDVRAIYNTEGDAKRIHDALRGILGIARLSTPSDAPEILRLYDAIQVSMDKATVRVSASIAAELIDKSAERLQRGKSLPLR